jgi:hypothetical protein
MMAETIYYLQATISARNFYNEGKFGDIFYSESEYQHDGLQEFYFEYGKRKTYMATWCCTNALSNALYCSFNKCYRRAFNSDWL